MKPQFAHQTESIAFFRDKRSSFDASDPGTGKTRVVVETVRDRVRSDNRAILVLGPKSSMRSAWAADIREYAPELMVSIAYADKRAQAFAIPADVYITNHDATNWLVKQPASFFKRFSTLIIDESGAFKHHTAKRSKACAKIAKNFEFVHAMNGTPNPNSITDVWHQYFIVDRGVRLGKSFFQFRNATCCPQQVGPRPEHLRWQDREGAADSVAALVQDITMRHVFEECVTIPPNHEYSVKFVLKPAHMKQYKTMQQIEMLPLKDGTITAINAAAVSTKLLQIASGAAYEDSETYHLIDSDRYELVLDLIEQRPHSVCFFLWAHQRDELIKAAEARGVTFCLIDGTVSQGEREASIRGFQAGYFRVMFAHPQSAAHSLTLVKGTRTIWASPTYNLEHFMQGNRRIYRAGQTEKTETIVVVAEDTLDEKVFQALSEKRLRMESLLDQLQEAA